MNDLRIVQASSPDVIIASPAAGATIDDMWWRLFDVRRALEYVNNLIADKGSDRNPEQHTRKAYEGSLRMFLNWAGPRLAADDVASMTVYELAERYPAMRFPGPELMREFVGYLKQMPGKRGGMAKATIDRHMAAVHHLIKGLCKQYIAVKGDARDFVQDCKEFMMQSLDEKVSDTEQASDGLPALYSYGHRLGLPQLDSLLAAVVADESLRGKRDAAVLYLGFTSALRDAELRRLTLNNITAGEMGARWEIRVRGKRNNKQPVPMDNTAHVLIMRWVDAYNAGLDDNDPRRIVGDVPIFQPLLKGDHYAKVGVNKYSPCRGMSHSGVREIVRAWSLAVLGIELNPHDMRRSAASIGRRNGMDFEQLQFLLRHSSIATTQRYVGNPPDLGKSQISNYLPSWSWSVA